MTQEGGSAERSTKLAELEIQLSFPVFLKNKCERQSESNETT